MDKFIKFSTPEALSGIKQGIVALGVFDGVHLGHRKVIGAARELAKEFTWNKLRNTDIFLDTDLIIK